MLIKEFKKNPIGMKKNILLNQRQKKSFSPSIKIFNPLGIDISTGERQGFTQHHLLKKLSFLQHIF
jgi:hypothetical protein